jgi:diguanylate cyclase (GGDEF)-like protein/PAS domain S-box-containing protein
VTERTKSDSERFVWDFDPVTLLGSVAATANAAASPREALDRALEHVIGELGWPLAHAYEVTPDGRLRPTDWALGPGVSAESVFEFREATDSTWFDPGTGLPGRVLATRAPAWIEDVLADPNFPRAAAAERSGLRAAFAFPVLTGNNVSAVLEFFCRSVMSPERRFLEVAGQIGYQLGVVYERHRAVRALQESEARTRQVLDTAADGFIAMDTTGKVTEWNAAAERLFGWTRSEALGEEVAELIVPEELRSAHREGLERYLRTGEARVLGERLELPAVRRDGVQLPLEITLWSLRSNERIDFYAFARDITARKVAEEELAHRATHDELTELPNRATALKQLGIALAEQDEQTALLFVDLDRFKVVNDSLGHAVGDRLLLEVAERLSKAIRPSDTLARLAGDEFLIICHGIAGLEEATGVAERVSRLLEEPVNLGGDSVRVTASIGVCMAEPGSSPEEVVRASDAAMYQAKSAGKGRFEVFDEGMRAGMDNRLKLERDLETAVEQAQFRLHYQPLVSLITGQLVGVEALVRWKHPDLGLLYPDSFIPLAEETGAIIPMGEWVLGEACRQAKQWEQVGLSGLEMAVNLSGRQLAQSDFKATVSSVLRDAEFNPGQMELCLEITESLLMADPEAAAESLRELKGIGVTLAIDDFGTGYSSLAYLKWFPVDTVKLDRSFVSGVATERVDRAIVSAVVEMAHALGISVVAEGVEDTSQYEALMRAGCDRAQGYLMARPQAPSDLEPILAHAISARRRIDAPVRDSRRAAS